MFCCAPKEPQNGSLFICCLYAALFGGTKYSKKILTLVDAQSLFCIFFATGR